MTQNNPTIPANAPPDWAHMAAIWRVMIYVTMITNILTAVISAAYGFTPVMMVALSSCILMVLYLFTTFTIDKITLSKSHTKGNLIRLGRLSWVAAGIGYCAMLVSMGASISLLVSILGG